LDGGALGAGGAATQAQREVAHRVRPVAGPIVQRARAKQYYDMVAPMIGSMPVNIDPPRDNEAAA
jgi:hypothetical protein